MYVLGLSMDTWEIRALSMDTWLPTREREPVMVEVLTNLPVDNKKGWVYEEWTSLVNQRWKRWRTDQMFPVREGEPAMMEVLTNLLVDYNKGHVWEEWTTLPA